VITLRKDAIARSSFETSFEFPASLIKQYLYCPRIPYFILVFGIRERVTELMKSGKEYHAKKLKKLREEGWETNVFLRSKKYGIYGYVDALKKDENGYTVLEVKDTEYRRNAVKMHLYQAASYALMVEEVFGRVCRIVILYRDKEVEFPFNRGIKRYCVSIINKIKRICENGLVYRPNRVSRCKNCGFFKFCRGL